MGKYSVEEVLADSQYKQYDMVGGGPALIQISQAGTFIYLFLHIK